MKKLIIAAASFLFIMPLVNAQTNFYTQLDSLYQHDTTLSWPDSQKTGVQKQIDRIKKLYTGRLMPHGDFSVASNAIMDYANTFGVQGAVSSANITPATWQEEGPFEKANDIRGGGGNGQINRICYHPKFNLSDPTYDQTIYAGSFHGGLWKSTNNGQEWSKTGTDIGLPQSSVSGIAVSYQQPELVYISTGEGDGRDLAWSPTGYSNPLHSGRTAGHTTSILSSGVYKSTDGGGSWSEVNRPSFRNQFTGNPMVRDIVIDYNDDNNLYLPTNEGLLKCSNANAPIPNWQKLATPTTISNNFSDLEIHPSNSSIIYAASDEIVKSSDGGATWSALSGPTTGLNLQTLPNGFALRRITLAVTSAANDNVYAFLVGDETTYRAMYVFKYEAGNWSQVFYKQDLYPSLSPAVGSSWMGITVSPVDEQTILIGSVGLNIVLASTDPNYSYQFIHASGSIHNDIHDIKFEPNSTSTSPDFLVAHHGGISQSYTKPAPYPSFVKYMRNRSDDINTSMLWSFDISNIDPDHTIMGRQDVGAHESFDKFQTWTTLDGGDGYGVALAEEHKNLQATDQRIVISTYSYKFNGRPTSPDFFANHQQMLCGNSFAYQVEIPNGFRHKKHPSIDKTIFGFDDLWSSYSSSVACGDPINSMEIQSDVYRNSTYNHKNYRRVVDFDIAASNDDYVYTVTNGLVGPSRPLGTQFYETALHLSTTGITNDVYSTGSIPRKFNDISANLPTINYGGQTYKVAITGIAVSKTDHQKAWICVNGYHNGQKVYYTDDAGGTWQNADANNTLPNLPTSMIVYQDGTEDRLYLATDAGVYVSEGIGAALIWKKLGSHFPNVMVNELKIHECSNRLYAATYGRGIWSTELLPTTVEKTSQVIATNTTWDENRVIAGNITVEAGSKLTINNQATIYMGSGSKIIIEPNAELEIDDATLTNSCGNYWYGIQIEGSSGPQTTANQGKLVLKNNAVLENVQYAINFGKEGQWNDFGGIVQAEDATFKVSRRAAAFMTYGHPNNSYFKRCTFEYVSGLTESPLSLVTIWDNHGVNFSGCTFKDETGLNQYFAILQNESIANGIYSIDATYQVVADCNYPPNVAPTMPCPSQYATRSSFTNFNQAIYAKGAATNKTVRVEETDFVDNAIGMRVKGLDNVKFILNTSLTGGVTKMGYPLLHQFGYHSADATGFEIEQNIFEKRSSATEDVGGINIVDSKTAANEIYKNTFRQNDVAQKLDELNRNTSASRGFIGLQFLCNTFENSSNLSTDVEVNPRGQSGPTANRDGIRNVQGSTLPDASAGNTFSLSTSFPEGHIHNNTAQIITYQGHAGAATPTQTTQTFVNTFTKPAPACSSKYWQSTGGGIPNGIIGQYYTLRGEYNNLLYNYHQLIDNGNTDSLLEAIGTMPNSDAQQMRDELMAEAPYLSQEVILDAAASGVLTDALLLEICLANPDATRDEGFLDFLEFEIPNPLSSTDIQLIYLNWDAETPRTLVENQLGSKAAVLGRLSSKILHSYAFDSTATEDSVIAMIQSKQTVESKYQLVEYRISKNEFGLAASELNAIASSTELNAAELNEHNNLVAYTNFRESIANEGLDYMRLNDAHLENLRSIATAVSGRTATFAQNILCFGYGECYFPETGASYRKRKPRIYTEIIPTATALNTVKLSPNPASDLVNIQLPTHFEMENTIFILTSMDGKEVRNQPLQQANSTLSISDLAKGEYFYQIVDSGKRIGEGKLIKL
jgi:hypothetical protein